MRYRVIIDVSPSQLAGAREGVDDEDDEECGTVEAQIEAEFGWMEASGISLVSIEEIGALDK